MRLDLQVADLRVAVESHSERLLEWLDAVYQPVDLPPVRQTLLLAMEETDSPYRLPIERPAHATFAEVAMGLSPCLYGAGRFYSIDSGEHVLEADFDMHRLRLNLGGRYLMNRPSFVHIFFCLTSRSFILPFFSLTTLHGALLTRDGQTVFLVGQAGAGKSTCTLQLIQDGWSVLADDSPVFAMEQGRAVAYCSPEALRVTAGTLQAVPGYAPLVDSEADYAGKYSLAKSGVAAATGPLGVTHIVRLDRRPVEAPSVRPVPRPEIMQRLVQEAMIIFRQPRLRQAGTAYSRFLLDIIAGLVQNAATVALTYANGHLPQLSQILSDMS